MLEEGKLEEASHQENIGVAWHNAGDGYKEAREAAQQGNKTEASRKREEGALKEEEEKVEKNS